MLETKGQGIDQYFPVLIEPPFISWPLYDTPPLPTFISVVPGTVLGSKVK